MQASYLKTNISHHTKNFDLIVCISCTPLATNLLLKNLKMHSTSRSKYLKEVNKEIKSWKRASGNKLEANIR